MAAPKKGVPEQSLRTDDEARQSGLRITEQYAADLRQIIRKLG
ncbi:hypothetical protein [Bradyrhizobium sp. 23AC]